MFDTHCHLNFNALADNVDAVILQANEAGVTHFVVPGTDVPTSQKAIDIAHKHENVYAAVGIHPHHVFEAQQKDKDTYKASVAEVEELLIDDRVVAVGEVGLDRHYYAKTKYKNYGVTEKFVKAQCDIFAAHVKLAIKYKKSLIIHHREAKEDLLKVLGEVWSGSLARKAVIHCCEPDHDLLAFAKKNNLLIGVDGDVTYDKKKQQFIKEVPLDMLVLETDAPFLIPEPYRSQPRETRGPNVPAHLPRVAEKVAILTGMHLEDIKKITFANATELFQLQ